MALTGTDRGQGSTNAAGQSSLAVVPASNCTAGALVVLCVAYDNSGSAGADPFSAISDTRGNVWTTRANQLNDPGAASAGVALRIFTTKQTAGALTTGDTITVSFGGSTTVARAWTLMEITAAAGSNARFQSGGSGGTTGSSGTPSLGSIAPALGNLLVCCMGAEGNSAITGDSDTTNGSWSTQQTSGIGTTTGGMEITSQRKVISGFPISTQTYNVAMTSADWAIAYIIVEEVAGITVTPPTTSLVITTFAPVVSVAAPPVVVTPPTASLAITSFAPTVLTPRVVTPPTRSVVITTFAPTVLTPRVVTPPTYGLKITTFAPDVTVSTGGGGVVVTPPAASLTLTTFAPTVSTPRVVTPGTASLVITSFAPTVSVGGPVVVTPDAASLTITTFAPVVTISVSGYFCGTVTVISLYTGAVARSHLYTGSVAISEAYSAAVTRSKLYTGTITQTPLYTGSITREDC